ncbi:hypothetical protein K3495_g3920 [Podosphaera aphanis]|nr:hypothetical protein K3495_g3920 [Podosphaera aphanis]
MALRGRSKERDRKSTPPGPVYMSSAEFAEYLKNLRNNRIARPSEIRHFPSHSRPEHDETSSASAVPIMRNPTGTPSVDMPPRSSSAFSGRRAHSSLSNSYSSIASYTGRQLAKPPIPDPRVPPLKPSDVVPSATYIERGQRWMEKEDAVALREAMEEMNLKEELEELRIHAAAQKEASELVWQYEYPDSVAKPDQPYRYNQHLKKNSYQYARAQSASRKRVSAVSAGVARDNTGPSRSVSGGSDSSDGVYSRRGRTSTEVSDDNKLIRNQSAESKSRLPLKAIPQIIMPRVNKHEDIACEPRPLRRRLSTKRNISGEIVSGAFTGDQIWEEKNEENQKITTQHKSTEAARDSAVPLRVKPKNPLNRVQFATDVGPPSNSCPSEPKKRHSAFEIHKNPPSQSRNPSYVANPPPTSVPGQRSNEAQSSTLTTKNGLEIRSDEIRQATSMRLKDRSTKLPTPTIVSDKPGRPIVSFDSNWKPKEADVKPEKRRSPFDRRVKHNLQKIEPTKPAATNVSAYPQTSLSSSRPSATEMNKQHAAAAHSNESFASTKPPIPSITLPNSTNPTRIVNPPDTPSISISVPSISVTASPEPRIQAKRPLPIPGAPRNRFTDQKTVVPQGHWSPAVGRRATATCHQCGLPIEGRVLKISNPTEHFHPECFRCFTCGTELESLEIHPEPSPERAERLDRIRRRAEGQPVPDTEGQLVDDDGDGRQRYYCHLDFHEKFSPKCKHCKTPIIGEHLVALGEHWHHGHFFCAECGDPFEKGMTHVEKDGYAWCLRCQTRRTENQAPKCRKCKESVIGEYVRALGEEWHERCFRCAVCENRFDDGVFYPKQTPHGVTMMCIQCIERELKA